MLPVSEPLPLLRLILVGLDTNGTVTCIAICKSLQAIAGWRAHLRGRRQSRCRCSG